MKSMDTNEKEVSEECQSTVIDLEMSMGGKNAYYHHCNHYQGRTNYAACLHTINAVQGGRTSLRNSCVNAIQCAGCPAMKMRERERQEGRALFFIDRLEIIRKLDEANAQPSTVVLYGKRRVSTIDRVTSRSNPEAVESFHEKLQNKTPTARPQQKDEAVNTDMAGRNLLGEAIDKMMGSNP